MPLRFRSRMLGGCAGMTLLSLMAAPAAYAQIQTYTFDIPAQDMASALRAFARQSQQQVIFPGEVVRGKTSQPLKGQFSVDPGLAVLLADSGLTVRRSNRGVLMVEPAGPPVEAGAAPATEVSQLSEIVVTGSRIRGAPPSSPVIILSQESMRNAGVTDLGQAMRMLPQNFAAGQNPSVALDTPSTANGNGSGGSFVDLRGLGPDATLTLVNGRRLAYNGQIQGVDISAIPLAAVDRVEVIADGASALYGTDAVGGVVNVLLRRDYEGVMASARFGASTDGGNKQQQYEIVTGSRWSGGGVMVAANYSDTSGIRAGQRAYLSSQNPTHGTQSPSEGWSTVFSGHQAISDTVKLEADASYNQRRISGASGWNRTDAYTYNGSALVGKTNGWSVAPRLKLTLPAGWNADLGFTYGRDEMGSQSRYWINGVGGATPEVKRNNTSRIWEASAEGPIFQAPGGAARTALGAGRREISIDVAQAGSALNFVDKQPSTYVYGEVFVPFAAKGEGVLNLERFSLTAAARYEDYSGIDKILVPKIGLVLAPSQNIEFRASWGKSFKAPVLARMYQGETDLLYGASQAGAVGVPATATVLARWGGNPDLKPERAKSLTVGAVLTPRALPKARIEVSYFRIDYTDKVSAPFSSATNALQNPLYQSYIIYNPDPAVVADIVANAEDVLQNLTSYAFDPTAVVALLDMRYTNTANVKVQGVDFSARYDFDLGAGGDLTADLSGTYLDSKQRLLPGQPYTDLSGRIFSPPHIRARGGLTWRVNDLTLTGMANYTGKLTDYRRTPVDKISDQVTYDLTARYEVHSGLPVLGDLSLSASVLNLTNEAPPRIYVSAAQTPFDSTNYSAIGRFVSVSVAKRW